MEVRPPPPRRRRRPPPPTPPPPPPPSPFPPLTHLAPLPSQVDHARALAATLTSAAYGPSNSWAYCAPTADGTSIGLYARQALVAGQVIGAFGGPLLPVRPFLRVPEGVLVLPQPPGNPLFLDCAGNNAPFHELHDAAHPAAHARHNSMTPNARVELRRRTAKAGYEASTAAEEVETSLVATRAIPAGGEITFNHRCPDPIPERSATSAGGADGASRDGRKAPAKPRGGAACVRTSWGGGAAGAGGGGRPRGGGAAPPARVDAAAGWRSIRGCRTDGGGRGGGADHVGRGAPRGLRVDRGRFRGRGAAAATSGCAGWCLRWCGTRARAGRWWRRTFRAATRPSATRSGWKSREQRGGDDDDDGDAAAAEWRSDVLRAAPRAPGALATAMRSRGGDRGSGGGGGSGRERLSDAYGSPRAAKRQRSNRDRGGDDDGDDDDDDDGVTDEARAAADAATRLRSRIGERQESHGVTQKEVAAAVGVTQSAFSIWFGGRPQSAIMRAKIDAGVATYLERHASDPPKPRPPPMARAEASASGGGNAAGAETGDDDHGVLNAPMLRRQLTALMAARNLLQKEVAPQMACTSRRSRSGSTRGASGRRRWRGASRWPSTSSSRSTRPTRTATGGRARRRTTTRAARRRRAAAATDRDAAGRLVGEGE